MSPILPGTVYPIEIQDLKLTKETSKMNNTETIYIGLDVDDKAFTGTAIDSSGKIFSFKTRPNSTALAKKLTKINKDISIFDICYESTYLGFSLARSLQTLGYKCCVIASSLIPELASKKVKTDRLDSEKIALHYMKGMLTVVTQPDEVDEAVSHIARMRKFIVEQIKGSKNRLKSVSRIFDVQLPKSRTWSQTYLDELMTVIRKEESSEVRFILSTQVNYLKEQISYLKSLEEELASWSTHDRYKSKHDALIGLRGIKTLSAMSIITDVGDVKRFSHPKKLASYLGLDIQEYSSGGKERKGGITKMGNKRLRTILVESNQIMPRSSLASASLRRRRVNATSKQKAIAIKWDERVYDKSRKLLHRGKERNKIKVACAREQVGFIWEMLNNC